MNIPRQNNETAAIVIAKEMQVSPSSHQRQQRPGPGSS